MAKDRLQEWWDGLSGPDRVRAKRAAESGELDAETRESFEQSGLSTTREVTSDAEIVTFLKSRH